MTLCQSAYYGDDGSELRVVDRSQIGGHYVDPRTISDNFYGNLEILNEHYELFQTVQIIDTSEAEHVVLIVLKNGKPTMAVPSEMLLTWFQRNFPSITPKIRVREQKF